MNLSKQFRLTYNIIHMTMHFYAFAYYITTFNIKCRTSIQPVVSYM